MSLEFDIENLCQLAQLEISAKEKKELEAQLQKIVSWVDQLKILPLERREEESALGCPPPNKLRPDKVLSGLSSKKALDNAPEKEKDFFKVPKVIDFE